MHGSGPCGRARGICKPFAYSSFNFQGLGREGGKGVIVAVSDANICRMERRSRGPVPNALKRQIRRRRLGFAEVLIRQGNARLSKQVMFGRLEVQGAKREGRNAKSWGGCLQKHFEPSGRSCAKAKNRNGSHSMLLSRMDGIG